MAQIPQHHDHDLKYLLKEDGFGRYYGRVREVPAIIAHGKSIAEVEKKLQKGTLDYFKKYHTEHVQVYKKPTSRLTSSGKGTILEIKPLKVQC